MTCPNPAGAADPERCETYCTDHEWTADCLACGKPVTMVAARAEVIVRYHVGCFGWPFYGCPTRHQGECESQTS